MKKQKPHESPPPAFQIDSDSDNLARDCKAFYERRLQLTTSVEHKWTASEDTQGGSQFSKLPSQISQLRSELLSLAHLDNELFKNLLALNDKLEELKLQRDPVASSQEDEDLPSEEHTTTSEEYDDDDIDEEVDKDEFNVYSSLPPTQILEAAAASADPRKTSENNGGGLDVMGGLKFMLRSRSFLLRPPFHKKSSSHSNTLTTPRRSRITSSDSPFR